MKQISLTAVRKALAARLPGANSDRSPSVMSGMMTSGSGHIFTRAGTPFDLSGGQKATSSEALVGAGRTVIDDIRLPDERFLRYPLLDEMADNPTLSSALNIHLTHALSYDKRTNRIMDFEPVTTGDQASLSESQKICDELNGDLMRMVNENVAIWAHTMSVYGVSYVRPYAEPGLGITGFECDYYTLPHFVREYHLGGELAGFTGDYLKSHLGAKVLAEPWDLIPMRVPFWRPKHTLIPTYNGTETFNLLSDPMARAPSETQNYGTSLLESAYEPYINLKEAIRALKSTRLNSSKIDRIIGLAMNGLDPVQAAKYSHTISQTLKRASDLMESRARHNRWAPSVTNTLLPIMGTGTGGLNIDTQSIDANITGMEDVLMYIRQIGSAVGLDYSLLGWADSMSGGLGEGGFLRTSIQAAARSQWIRLGVETFLHRAVDIHLANKFGKVYLPNQRPYKIRFNSANTAIQQDENDAADSRANYASVITTIMDAISNNSTLSKSDSFKQMLFGTVLNLGDDYVSKLVSEIKMAAEDNSQSQGTASGLFESLAALDRDTFNRVMSDINA